MKKFYFEILFDAEIGPHGTWPQQVIFLEISADNMQEALRQHTAWESAWHAIGAKLYIAEVRTKPMRGKTYLTFAHKDLVRRG